MKLLNTSVIILFHCLTIFLVLCLNCFQFLAVCSTDCGSQFKTGTSSHPHMMADDQCSFPLPLSWDHCKAFNRIVITRYYMLMLPKYNTGI